MAWTPSRDLLSRLLEEHLNGATPPNPVKFYIILTNSSTFGDASTVADIVKQELVEQYGYTRVQYNPGMGAYDAAQSRYEMPGVTIPLNATGGAIQYDRAVLLANAHPTANKIFTANAATNRLTVTAHGLSNGDAVVPSSDPASTLPTGMSAIAYYAKAIDANTVELYTESALTNIVDFSDAGSGTLRLRYAQGFFEFYEVIGSSTIPDGSTQSLVVYFNVAGSGVDVNAA